MNQDAKTLMQEDEYKIDQIVNQFFDLFTNTNNRKPNIQNIREIFLPNGILINNTNGEPEVNNLEDFIRPREEILTNGTLINFTEKESSHKTEIHGNIAQRMSNYIKSGELNEKAFTGGGKKLMHFVKVKNKWFFSSVIWSDKN